MTDIEPKDITIRENIGIENMIQRGLGYLKVPKAFKDQYGSPVYYPEPLHVSMIVRGEGVLLIYEFSKAGLDRCRRDRRERMKKRKNKPRKKRR